MTEQPIKVWTWTTSSSAHGLSSTVQINVNMDVTDAQILEKAQKEYSRNIQAKLRGMDVSKISALNKDGTWTLNASEFHIRGDMSLDRAVSNVKANAKTMSAAERAALIAALSEAMEDGETSTDTETETETAAN